MKYAEIIFALYIVISRLKGDPRIASLLPFDLTVTFAALVYLAIAMRLKTYDWSLVPKVFWLYVPFICLLILSVLYSPLPEAGAEKAARFVFLTGLAIIAPFFVLDTPQRMQRFFLTLGVVLLATSVDALMHAGDGADPESDGRLTVSGGSTTELGTAAVTGVAIVLFLLLPVVRNTGSTLLFVLKKLGLYLITAVFFLALIGSGARSATLSLVAVFLLNAVSYRDRIPEFFILACVAASSLLFFPLPESSFEYLATLLHSDTGSLLNWRGHLMHRGLELFIEHPLFGVGFGGFPYFGTDPPPAPWFLYNWPHNVLIEIACEVGLFAVAIVCALIVSSFLACYRQLRLQYFQFKVYTRMGLASLLFGLITFLNTGDVNDNRIMWFYLSVPFVVGNFPKTAEQDLVVHRYLRAGIRRQA